MDPIYDLIIIGFTALIVGINLYYSPSTEIAKKTAKKIQTNQEGQASETFAVGPLLSGQSSHT